jgi:hypothetical protein
LEACKGITTTEQTKIGSYRGFDMLISFDTMSKEFRCDMKGSMTHTAMLGSDSFGNITRINNAFDKIPQRLQSSEVQLQTLYEQVENAKTELQRPFPQEQELADKTARLAELDTMLNMDENPGEEKSGEQEHGGDDVPERESEAMCAKEKPSILKMLEQGEAKSRAMFGAGEKSEKSREVSL